MNDQSVYIMAALRFLSGLIEISAAVLIIRFHCVETALRINGLLAIIGPTLLVIGIFVGAAALTDRLPLGRLLFIYAGALLIFWGTR